MTFWQTDYGFLMRWMSLKLPVKLLFISCIIVSSDQNTIIMLLCVNERAGLRKFRWPLFRFNSQKTGFTTLQLSFKLQTSNHTITKCSDFRFRHVENSEKDKAVLIMTWPKRRRLWVGNAHWFSSWIFMHIWSHWMRSSFRWFLNWCFNLKHGANLSWKKLTIELRKHRVRGKAQSLTLYTPFPINSETIMSWSKLE